jgi:hypothetical protein
MLIHAGYKSAGNTDEGYILSPVVRSGRGRIATAEEMGDNPMRDQLSNVKP